jgi:antitoxin component YwqK of YwqJK toxin-antitoxin module
MKYRLAAGGLALLFVLAAGCDEHQRSRARAIIASATGVEDPCPGGTQLFEKAQRRWCENAQGQKHGPFRSWHPAGVRAAMGRYRGGLCAGLWTTWHANGQRESNGHCEHGEQTGHWVWWYPNGQVAVVGDWRHGRPHGQWTYWHHRQPRKLVTARFCDGTPCGIWLRYDADGNVVERSDYRVPEG